MRLFSCMKATQGANYEIIHISAVPTSCPRYAVCRLVNTNVHNPRPVTTDNAMVRGNYCIYLTVCDRPKPLPHLRKTRGSYAALSECCRFADSTKQQALLSTPSSHFI